MTDLNDDPYKMTYFPTYRDTRKVEGVEKDTHVLIAILIIGAIMAQCLLRVKWINDKINAMLEEQEVIYGSAASYCG
ncbi:unnamed protein product [marine sediment metagenome]|uniref:Uncharacterized protein n=1 Tax=marine sediment metagenome TaxID=412755 RepID=X0RG86_9ZZZZ